MFAVEIEAVAGGPEVRYTDHALLVVWGQFAREFGLVAELMKVPIGQKAVEHAPQTKLVQLLVATLAGTAHLQEMAEGPRPLVKDRAVAEAWGQPGWADPSGVSRTFLAADERTVAAALGALGRFSRPFIDREVALAIGREGVLRYDADLTGREVSPTSRSYPGAAFGWMGDHVGLGYQAAVVSLASPSYGRLLLSGERHPGDTVSETCLVGLVRAAEAATGARPLRRPELVAGRLDRAAAESDRRREQVGQAERRLAAAEGALAVARAEAAARAAEVAALVARAPAGESDRPERPHGHLAKACARQETAGRRLGRREGAVARAEAGLAKQRELLARSESARAELSAHHARLVAENEANAAPIRAAFRLDAGFGSGANLTWLIEMGYEVYTKAHNARVTAALLAAKPEAAPWQPVGKNAELWVRAGARVSNCPYPLDVAVERFHTGETLRHGTLLHYGSDPVAADPPGWFARYNGRQTIEAAIKENKGVFQMRHLKLRSPAGLALAEAFALFAANLVRWAAAWLAEAGVALPAPFAPAGRPLNVKQLVRTGANTAAWVSRQPRHGVVVSFSDRGPFKGKEIAIGCNGSFQPPLPLLKAVQNSPPMTIQPPVAQNLR